MRANYRVRPHTRSQHFLPDRAPPSLGPKSSRGRRLSFAPVIDGKPDNMFDP